LSPSPCPYANHPRKESEQERRESGDGGRGKERGNDGRGEESERARKAGGREGTRVGEELGIWLGCSLREREKDSWGVFLQGY